MQVQVLGFSGLGAVEGSGCTYSGFRAGNWGVGGEGLNWGLYWVGNWGLGVWG